jgi:hypothetical protein
MLARLDVGGVEKCSPFSPPSSRCNRSAISRLVLRAYEMKTGYDIILGASPRLQQGGTTGRYQLSV